MGCFAPWVFRDNVGQTWALAMNGAGQLTFTQLFPPLGNNAMAAVPLTDIVTGLTVNVTVVFTSSPVLTTVPSSGPAIGNYIPLTRPVVGTYKLQVSNGSLVANPVGDGPGIADPVVGQLFNYDMVNPPVNPPNLPNAGLLNELPGGWLPAYKQPGGIGGQTTPAQASGSTSQITGIPYEVGMGLNVCADGHWFNMWDITFATVNCTQAAIIRCPLCGYVQQIISPASLLYTDPGLEHISS